MFQKEMVSYFRSKLKEIKRNYTLALEKNDFDESNASTEDVPAVMHELSNNIAGFNAAFLLYEASLNADDKSPTNTDTQFCTYLLLGHGLRPRRREIQEVLSATRENGALVFKIIAPTIEAAEQKAHEKIKQILP